MVYGDQAVFHAQGDYGTVVEEDGEEEYVDIYLCMCVCSPAPVCCAAANEIISFFIG